MTFNFDCLDFDISCCIDGYYLGAPIHSPSSDPRKGDFFRISDVGTFRVSYVRKSPLGFVYLLRLLHV